MEDDVIEEIEGGEPLPVDTETTPEPDVQDAEPQEGVDYEVVGDGRFRWMNENVVTDAEGNPVGDEPAPTVPADVVETPKPEPKAVQVAPVPRTATETTQRPIYTREATKAAIFTDEALAEIAEVAYTDGTKAERMRADLAERYQSAVAEIDRLSNRVFETELDEIAAVAPKSVAGLTREIQRVKEQMTPEQRQQPGSAKAALVHAIAQAASRDLLVAEEIFVRSTTHQRVETPAKPAPAAPRRPAVIPPADRAPSAGSARRVTQPRRPAGAGGPDTQLVDYAKFQKSIHPDWTQDECMAVAKSSLEAEQNRRAPR